MIKAKIHIRWWENGGLSPHCVLLSITDFAISYVHGIMDGEAVADILAGKDKADIFRLR